MEIKNLTLDDQAYNAKIKQWILEVMDRAEICKKHLETQYKPKNKAGFNNVHDEVRNKQEVGWLLDEMKIKGMVSDGKRDVWNSASALFDDEGNDPEKFEIGTIPKRTTGTISKPMAPKEELKGDALSQMIEECIVPWGSGVKWTDIQGLADVKKTLMETIIYP